MKILRSLAVAALLLPLAACDDNGGDDPMVDPVFGTVSGVVSIEGEGVQGVTVTLSTSTPMTMTTGADGSYAFTNVEAGTYSVSLSNLPSDATFTNPTATVTIASSGQVVPADFSGNFIRTAAITGVVMIDEEPVSGVSVTIDGIESQNPTSTDNLGMFAFTGLRAGAYSVSITSPDEEIDFGATTQNVTLAVGQTASLTFAGFVPQEPTASISRITTGNTNTPINPEAVRGQIDVTVEWDAGDETAESVAVILRQGTDEWEIDRQDFSTTGSGVSGGGDWTVSENTAKLQDGSVVDPVYLNGEYDILVRLVTVEGSTVEGELRDPLVFDNLDVLSVVATTPNSDGVVSGGRRWFGGANGATYEARAVIYSADIDIDMLGVSGMNVGGSSANAGAASVDLGSGAGLNHNVAGNPASYSATFANNGGGPEDLPAPIAAGCVPPAPCDANGDGVFDLNDFGHSFMVTAVIDTDGVDRLPEILANNPAAQMVLGGQLLDFVGPVTDISGYVDTNANGYLGDLGDAATATASNITFDAPATTHPIDGDAVDAAIAGGTDFDDDATATTPGRWFMEATFDVDNVQELGVGYIGGAAVVGRDIIFNADDVVTPAANVFTNVKGVSMDTSTDANGAGFITTEADEPMYAIELQSISDALGNTATLTGAAGVSTGDDVADDNFSDEFGVDFGAAELDTFAPTPNAAAPDGTTGTFADWILFNNLDADVDDDHDFEFQIDEQALADASAGSGVDEADIMFSSDATPFTTAGEVDYAGAIPAAAVEHDQAAGFVNVTGAINVEADMTASAAGAGLATGAYRLFATVTDNATNQNIAVQDWWAVLVSNAAAVTLIDAPSDTNTNAPRLTFTVQAEVTQIAVALHDDGVADDNIPLAAVWVIVAEDVGADGCDAFTLAGYDTDADGEIDAGDAGAAVVGGNDFILAADGTATNSDGNILAQTLDADNRFSQEVTLVNSGGAADARDICFTVVTQIDAVDNDGAVDPIFGFDQAIATVTWN